MSETELTEDELLREALGILDALLTVGTIFPSDLEYVRKRTDELHVARNQILDRSS